MAYLGLSGLTDKEVNDSVPRRKPFSVGKATSKLLYNLSRFGSARPYS